MTPRGDQRPSRFSRAAWAYALGISLLLAAIVTVLILQNITVHNPWAVLVFVLLGVLSEYHRSRTTRETSMSLSGLLMVIAIAVSGPIATIVVGVVPSIIMGRTRARAVLPRIFNPAMSGLAGGVGALCYLWLGGQLPVGAHTRGVDLVFLVLVPLVLANFVTMLTNYLVVSGMILLTSSERVSYTLWRMIPATAVVYGEYSFLAFIIVVLWGPVGLGITSLVIAALPLLAAQWDMSQMAHLRLSQARTLSTLREMIDAHQPGNGDRGQRVAATAVSLAEAVHVPVGHMQDLEHAAQLADLRSVTPYSNQGVSPESTLDPTAAIDSVEFLEGASAFLSKQDECWDGSGPEGLQGEDIPLVTRVVTVAHAYWVFRDRYSPEQALGAVDELNGSWFDPQCVEALRDIHDRVESNPGQSDDTAIEDKR